MSRLSQALRLVAAELPQRTSLRQLLAFVTVAQIAAEGRSVTLSELNEILGDDAAGIPMLGVSFDRVFDTFIEPTRRMPDRLGWCFKEEDPDDLRKKYLRLTPKGWAVAQRLIDSLNA
jgi:hypothetical protein